MNVESIPTATLTTLRYWAPGPFASSFGDDATDHEAPAYDGLADCLSRGLLEHVPNFSQWADGYRPTHAGNALLSNI